MKHLDGNFKGEDGLDLYYQAWLPATEPRAVVVAVHGLAEHSGRYSNLVDRLLPQGYAVYMHDLRGHGRSHGRSGHVERFSLYLKDLKLFLEIVADKQPERPIFLLGHSIGGTIVTAYAAESTDGLAGVILSAPTLRPGSGLSRLTIFLARLLSRIAPKLGVTTLDANGISQDKAVVDAYVKDPLVYHGKISARLGGEILSVMRQLPERTPRIEVPTLIMHGSDDVLSDPQGSQHLYGLISSADKTLTFYDGFHHELFNEPGRDQVLADLEAWLAAHTE